MEPLRYRTIWISDFHLGTRDCRADLLLDFLRHNDAERWYLVGDVFDGWALRKSWYWEQTHNDVVQKLLRKARKGARVTYIPGNHDEFAREFVGNRFGEIAVQRSAVHTTADGKQLLVLHGDEFDGIIRHARWLSKLGSSAYRFALATNRHYNTLRKRMGRPYWSLSAWLKGKTKRAVQFVADFSTAVAAEAAKHDVDGVVCGHIHCADDRMLGDVRYLNCGDWVESCTALVEHHDGRLELIWWTVPASAPSAPPAHSGDGVASEPILSAALHA
jgi:UDP-2,3-diacylglucosamine pyrophosphatase LpxH